MVKPDVAFVKLTIGIAAVFIVHCTHVHNEYSNLNQCKVQDFERFIHVQS